MFEHLAPHRYSTPPPRSAPREYGRRRPGADRGRSATGFVATLITLVLATLTALTFIALSPVGIAIPVAILLIGGLTGGIVVMRGRTADERVARIAVPRPPSREVDDARHTSLAEARS